MGHVRCLPHIEVRRQPLFDFRFGFWRHGVAFAVLTGLGLRIAQDGQQTLWWVAALLLSGWLIECLQQLVPDRGFSWPDMAANAAGIAVVALPCAAYRLL